MSGAAHQPRAAACRPGPVARPRGPGCSSSRPCVVLIPTLLYYGGGWLQFGYRYFLDSIPFVWALGALGVARRGPSPVVGLDADRLERADGPGRGVLGVQPALRTRRPRRASGCPRNGSGAAGVCSRSCPPLNLTGDPPCPPATGDTSPVARSATLRAVRRPFASVDPARWDALVAGQPLGDPLQPLGLPPRMVGRVRRQRPRGDARRGPGRCSRTTPTPWPSSR